MHMPKACIEKVGNPILPGCYTASKVRWFRDEHPGPYMMGAIGTGNVVPGVVTVSLGFFGDSRLLELRDGHYESFDSGVTNAPWTVSDSRSIRTAWAPASIAVSVASETGSPLLRRAVPAGSGYARRRQSTRNKKLAQKVR